MQDRFKFRAIVKGDYYIDTPEKCEEFKPLILLENIDVLATGDIGTSEEDLEIAIRKQYSDLQDIYVECIMENFIDNSYGIDTYITITPEIIQQCTGLKDKNGKLIYEGDIIKIPDDYATYGQFACEKREVYWNEGFRLKPKWDARARGNWFEDTKDFEVIGNIYENPELLED